MKSSKRGRLVVSTLSASLALILVVLGLILFFVYLNPSGGTNQLPPSTPTPLPTATPGSSTEIATSVPTTKPTEAGDTTEPEFEITENTPISSPHLGELNVKYPLRMSPGSSDSVVVSIYIPDRLVSLVPMEIERIDIPPDAPLIIGELNSYQATVLITETMRVELSSPTFQIENLYPATQPVDIYSFSEPTFWGWTIVAPDTVGSHVLTLRVYLGQADRPSWVGSIEIEVSELSPTPMPFFNTPGGIALIGAAGVLIVALTIGLFRYRVTRNAFPIVNTKVSYQRTLKTLHQNLAHLEERAAQYGLDVPIKLMNEIEAIKEKIAEIEAKLVALDSEGPGS